jgi:phenylalanyl-tRNA synthetase alpha chain
MINIETLIDSLNDQNLNEVFDALVTAVHEESTDLISAEALDAFRLRWTGRRFGLMKMISERLKAANLIRVAGVRFNELNELIKREKVVTREIFNFREGAQGIDITLPGTTRHPGIPHPLLTTMDRIVEVFHHLGYSTSLGPQVESDFYNFEALNFPPNHPARDTQDTLQIAGQQTKPSRDRLLMRTHTSPVQIRSMLAGPPPLRLVIPGKVHRNDAADATHSPIFHQVEGLCVDTDITFSDLKGTLDHAMRALFGNSVKTRFFPSFFPFTEPSADVQISCIFCNGEGCRKCKHSGWIELLGCGMVDPAVFEAVTAERRRLGLDPTPYDPARISGFAFGMGVERIAMILHGVSDIGHFYSGDLRFLEQFA